MSNDPKLITRFPQDKKSYVNELIGLVSCDIQYTEDEIIFLLCYLEDFLKSIYKHVHEEYDQNKYVENVINIINKQPDEIRDSLKLKLEL